MDVLDILFNFIVVSAIFLVTISLLARKLKLKKNKELARQLVIRNIVEGIVEGIDGEFNSVKKEFPVFEATTMVCLTIMLFSAYIPVLGNIVSNTVLPLVFIIYTLFNSDMLKNKVYSNRNLLKYALKHTGIPESVVSFKIDMYDILNKKPLYLYDVETEESFPLYTCLETLNDALTRDDVDTKSPLVSEYLVENIVLLSTFMSILKSEDLVESLQTELGKKELKESVEQFDGINLELSNVLEFIKQEKIFYDNMAKDNKTLEDLNEIRSMKSFAKNVK